MNPLDVIDRPPESVLPGTRLGPYEVIAPLGAGGMAEVVRARDVRLGREVAVKLLPRELADSRERFLRFEQEARAAGLLSHPNVLAIFDVGSHDGAPYIVSELLEGETLRSRLERGPVPPREAASIAIQIARGLSAAHEKGIVHRDLKPDNVFLTRDGTVKLLDFGLVKLLRAESVPAAARVPDDVLTRTDLIVGTAGYMAPEQIRGEAVDERADLFALGTCLYEMLSGRRAFSRPSSVETMNAILVEEPVDVRELTPSTPEPLASLVRRCLEKRKELRFQSARDLAFALEALAPVGASGGIARVPSRAGRALSRKLAPDWRLLSGAAAGLLLGAAAVWLVPRERVTAPCVQSTLTQSGSDRAPAVSPDGRLVAFESSRDGRSRIWLKQVKGGAEVALTDGPLDSAPRFFPDGESILFTRRDTSLRPSLCRVPILGGAASRLVPDAADGDVSPDGTAVAFARLTWAGTSTWSLGLVPITGGDERILARFPTWMASPRFSPDGKLLAASESGSAQSGIEGSVVLVSLSGAVRRLPSPAPRHGLTSVAWLGDGRQLLLGVHDAGIAHAQGTGGTLFRLDVRSGAATPLVWWPALGATLDVLGDGRVVFEGLSSNADLQLVRLSDASVRWLTRGRSVDRQPVFAPDGERVVFSSDRGGDLDLWEVSTRTAAVRRLTDAAGEDWDPSWLPRGDGIVWCSRRRGRFEVWTAAADGGGARPLPFDGPSPENPTLSPDGSTLVFGSLQRGREGIWKAGTDGSPATLLASGVARQVPDLSADGRYVLFRNGLGTGRRSVEVLRLEDGTKVFEIPIDGADSGSGAEVGRARFLPGGKAIAFLGLDARGATGVFRQEFVPGSNTTASRRPLAGFDPERPVDSFGVSPDGASLVLSVREAHSNLVEAAPLPAVRRPGGR